MSSGGGGCIGIPLELMLLSLSLLLLTPRAFFPDVHDEVTTVSASKGTDPFLVSRSCAEVALVAERRARWRAPMGTSRLITPDAALIE